MGRPNYALKAAIYGKGLLQVDVAEAVGVTEMSLSQIVTGRRSASRELQMKLARVLGVDETELFPNSSA